jgi:hypothetical protein
VSEVFDEGGMIRMRQMDESQLNSTLPNKLRYLPHYSEAEVINNLRSALSAMKSSLHKNDNNESSSSKCNKPLGATIPTFCSPFNAEAIAISIVNSNASTPCRSVSWYCCPGRALTQTPSVLLDICDDRNADFTGSALPCGYEGEMACFLDLEALGVEGGCQF